MPLLPMAPLSWFAQSSDIGLLINLILLAGFVIVIFVGWLIYNATKKKVICRECGEKLQTHLDIENCPVCGALLKE